MVDLVLDDLGIEVPESHLLLFEFLVEELHCDHLMALSAAGPRQ